MIQLGKYTIDDDGNLRDYAGAIVDLAQPQSCSFVPDLYPFAKSTALTGERITYYEIAGISVRRFESAGKVWWCPASATVREVEKSFRELAALKRSQPALFEPKGVPGAR